MIYIDPPYKCDSVSFLKDTNWYASLSSTDTNHKMGTKRGFERKEISTWMTAFDLVAEQCGKRLTDTCQNVGANLNVILCYNMINWFIISSNYNICYNIKINWYIKVISSDML